VSSQHAGGTGQYATYYDSPPGQDVALAFGQTWYDYRHIVLQTVTAHPAAGVRLITPAGATVELESTTVQGVPRLTRKSQPGGAGCDAASSTFSYDAYGNRASADDFNGNRACFAHDMVRSLEVVRVEGLSNTTACQTVTGTGAALPTGGRKRSVQWHPAWPLPVKLAEARRFTTFVYNGQPDPFNGNAIASCAPAGATLPDGQPIAVLCKRIEQATTDSDGGQGFAAVIDAASAARITRYTYNALGQVLAETDPRNFTTTYAYHAATTAQVTLGDLMSITNPVGKVTTFDAYDRNGNLLSSTDPNGLVTTFSYDGRQRLVSRSMGGMAFRFDRDPIGQVTLITLPDGATLQQRYDTAHRLVGITDSAGNSITYTLDNAGQRTSEQVKDPQGALAANIARSFDALGRLQSFTIKAP
jgi:YD repeat-containing protein